MEITDQTKYWMDIETNLNQGHLALFLLTLNVSICLSYVNRTVPLKYYFISVQVNKGIFAII